MKKNLLAILFEQHKIWISYVKSFGCSDDIVEDFVMEMYIKLDLFYRKTDADLMFDDNNINTQFVFVTLKNAYTDFIRKENKQVFLSIEGLDFESPELEILNDNYFEKLEIVNKWKRKVKRKIAKQKKLEYSSELSNLNYKLFIYDKIFVEKNSVTKLSREIGITYWSLRNTIKNIKTEIKEIKL